MPLVQPPEPCQHCGHLSASPIHTTVGLQWLCEVCVDVPEALPEDVFTCDHCHSQKLESLFAFQYWSDILLCTECHESLSAAPCPEEAAENYWGDLRLEDSIV